MDLQVKRRSKRLQAHKQSPCTDWRAANAALRQMTGQIKNLKVLRDKVADLTELLKLEHPCDVLALGPEIRELCEIAEKRMKECEEK